MPARVIIKVKGHQYRWLAGGYDLEIGHFTSGLHGGYLVDSGLLRSEHTSTKAQLGSPPQQTNHSAPITKHMKCQ